ncbi:MAG: lipid-A-disaccharide synthase [Bacteroidales bacterium]|nr:lipid-A-disaccharide synthase [Bacteroidales bacterium]
MKYYFIAGEASGDLHASNLIKELAILDPKAEFRGFGGDKMEAAGTRIKLHYKEMAFMGVWEVLANLKKINRNFDICKNDILQYKPDALILIDYAGFNLRMAKFAKENGIKTQFYISPKVWAWKKSRIKKIKAFVDRLYCILPFEKDFFATHNYDVDYVGNPLVDAIENYKVNTAENNNQSFHTQNNLEEKPIIALLSGSRKQEIDRCLPAMINAVDSFKDYQFVIAGAPSIAREYYDNFIAGKNIKIVYDSTYPLLQNSYAAVVTSGTATLETALFNIPEVVIYKTSAFTYCFKPFVKIKFFSLVNIIMDQEVVKEFLQVKLEQKIRNELKKIIHNTEYRTKILNDYAILQAKMGKPGVSKRTAKLMFNFLNKN